MPPQALVAKLERTAEALDRRVVEEQRKGKAAEQALAGKLEVQLLRFREQEARLKAELEAEIGRGRATEVLLQRKLDEERARTRSTAETLGTQLESAQSVAAEARDAMADQLGGMRIGASALEAKRALEAEVAALSARLNTARGRRRFCCGCWFPIRRCLSQIRQC